jgi:hypothetical protein
VEFSQGSGLLLFVRTRSLALATVAVSWVMLGHVIDSQSGYLPNKMELGGAWNGTQPSTCCSLRSLYGGQSYKEMLTSFCEFKSQPQRTVLILK